MSYYTGTAEQVYKTFDNDHTNKVYDGTIFCYSRFSRGLVSQALYQTMSRKDKVARTQYISAAKCDTDTPRYEITMTQDEFDKMTAKLKELGREAGCEVTVYSWGEHVATGTDAYFAEDELGAGWLVNPEG